MKLEEKTITVDGLKTKFLHGGSGQKILLLHGWGSQSEKYRISFENFPENNGEVFIPDLPCFGMTGCPTEAWNISDYVEWVKKFIFEVKISDYVLVGHSFGGRIAIKFSSENPTNLKGIVLYSAAGITPQNKIKNSVYFGIAKTGKAILRILRLNFISNLLKKLLYKSAGVKDYNNANNQRKEIMKKVISENLEKYLKDISQPVVLLWGSKDTETPLSDAEIIRKEINNSQTIVVDGAGHAIHIENPILFASKIQEALRKLTYA